MSPAANTAAARQARGEAIWRALVDRDDLDTGEALRAAYLAGQSPSRAAARLGRSRVRLERLAELLEATEEGDVGWEAEAAELGRRVAALDAALAAGDRCRVCGHDLEDPRSVARGVGPDCYAKMRAADDAATDQEGPT